MKKKLLISFSGGKTSAYMLWWLLNKWEDREQYEIIVVFANTGKEAEGTLFFVDECSQEWNVPIWWVEAKCKDDNGVPFSEKGWVVKHRIVDYENASRNGEPFEEMISVLGIPSTEAPFCSFQLKKKAIESFASDIGWTDYYVAIGKRADEPKRLPPSEQAGLNEKMIYPFAFINPKVKREINYWWEQQHFNLDIHPDDGNCDNCWKKDDKRLIRNARRKPKSFDWWQLMTDKYGHLNPRNAPLNPPFNFYRGNKSPQDYLEDARSESKKVYLFSDTELYNGCNESCEGF